MPLSTAIQNGGIAAVSRAFWRRSGIFTSVIAVFEGVMNQITDSGL